MKFRLSMNIAAIFGLSFIAQTAQTKFVAAWTVSLLIASACGFILSCIDYAKSKEV